MKKTKIVYSFCTKVKQAIFLMKIVKKMTLRNIKNDKIR